MLAHLIFAVLLVAVAAHPNPFLPKEWHSHRVVGNSSSADVTKYFVTYSYPNSQYCKNEEAPVVFGLGFGVCVVGYDTCGKPVGNPVRYTFTKLSGGTLYFTYEDFAGTDCNSPPLNSSPAVMSEGQCYGDYRMQVLEGANTWKGVNKGVVSLTHYSSDCTKNPAMWTSSSYNYCFAYGATCATPYNTKYAKYATCSGDVASLSFYTNTDVFCSHVAGGDTLPGATCQAAAPTSGLWTSTTCNN